MNNIGSKRKGTVITGFDIFVLAVGFLGFVHLASAQQRPSTNLRPIGNGDSELYAVDGLSSKDVWAVGYKYQGSESFPLVEHWDGKAWSIIPNPPNVEQSQMYGVSAVAPNDVWIVGQTWVVSDRAYVIHWDGTSLQIVPPVNPGSYVALYDVAAVAPNDVWAVGSSSSNGHDYFNLVEHWDGTSWSVVPSESGAYDTLTGIADAGPNDIWAVGWTLTGAEILHWNGQAWTFSPTGSIGNYANFYGVAAIASNNVWAFGAGSGLSLTDHWNGSVWQLTRNSRTAPRGNSLYSGCALASNDVWAVGQSRDLEGAWHTLAMHYDGVSWRTIRTPNPGPGEFYTNSLKDVHAVAPDDVWAVGVGEQALTIHWDGQSWTEIPNPGSN